MEQKINDINEDTSTPNAPNIETTDENLTVDAMFQQSSLPSLGRQIFSVLPINGPTGGLFNIKKKAVGNEFELVKRNVEVYNSAAIKTALTQEAVQDLKAMHGKEANLVVGKLLRGLANDDENTKTLAFLVAQAKAAAGLTLTSSSNSEVTLFELTKKVTDLILEINKLNLRTYEACAIVPYKAVSAMMALSQYAGGDDDGERGLFIAKIGKTRYYTNPDSTSLVAYVVLRDSENPSKSSAVFSPYMGQIIEARDPDSGSLTYHIFNRYAITASPLHITNNEMIYSFAITL